MPLGDMIHFIQALVHHDHIYPQDHAQITHNVVHFFGVYIRRTHYVPSISLGCGNMRRHFCLSSHRQNFAAPFFSSPILRDVSSRRFFLNSAAVQVLVYILCTESCWISLFTSSFGKCRDGILLRRTCVNSTNVEILTSVET